MRDHLSGNRARRLVLGDYRGQHESELASGCHAAIVPGVLCDSWMETQSPRFNKSLILYCFPVGFLCRARRGPGHSPGLLCILLGPDLNIFRGLGCGPPTNRVGQQCVALCHRFVFLFTFGPGDTVPCSLIRCKLPWGLRKRVSP